VQLTRYTDYSLRVLIYLALHPDGATIREMADRYGVSQNHLIKVVHNLGKLGLIDTHRGKGGGVRLAADPAGLRIGQIVLKVEPGFRLAECFKPEGNTCPISGICTLTHVLREAGDSFIETLDQYTLADLCANKEQLLERLALTGPASGRAGPA